jgi:hypothetical protein
MTKRIFALIIGSVFLFVLACGVPQPTASTGGGGAEKPEDKILSEDEIESEMNNELGDTDGDEVEEEEAAVVTPAGGEATIEVEEETEEPAPEE